MYLGTWYLPRCTTRTGLLQPVCTDIWPPSGAASVGARPSAKTTAAAAKHQTTTAQDPCFSQRLPAGGPQSPLLCQLAHQLLAPGTSRHLAAAVCLCSSNKIMQNMQNMQNNACRTLTRIYRYKAASKLSKSFHHDKHSPLPNISISFPSLLSLLHAESIVLSTQKKNQAPSLYRFAQGVHGCTRVSRYHHRRPPTCHTTLPNACHHRTPPFSPLPWLRHACPTITPITTRHGRYFLMLQTKQKKMNHFLREPPSRLPNTEPAHDIANVLASHSRPPSHFTHHPPPPTTAHHHTSRPVCGPKLQHA